MSRTYPLSDSKCSSSVQTTEYLALDVCVAVGDNSYKATVSGMYASKAVTYFGWHFNVVRRVHCNA